MIVNTVKYYYDTEGKMTKKVITPASGSAQTTYYETNDDKNIVKFSAGGRTVTSHSKTDSFGRKVFDELQLGTDFVSRQFVYHAGKVTAAHKEKAKVKSSATTQLVSQIIRDIKAKARSKGIKGTKKLVQYLTKQKIKVNIWNLGLKALKDFCYNVVKNIISTIMNTLQEIVNDIINSVSSKIKEARA